METWDGFLHGVKCSNCDKVLGQNPAENYAGTYTGLCYTCERADVFVAKAEPDGAQHLSYPPHCPAWRRDREMFKAYTDCQECNGKGRQVISRTDAQGGSYPIQCESCSKRYHGHPIRVANAAKAKQIYDKANKKFLAALKNAGIDSMNREAAEPYRAKIAAEYRKNLDQLEKETQLAWAHLGK